MRTSERAQYRAAFAAICAVGLAQSLDWIDRETALGLAVVVIVAYLVLGRWVEGPDRDE